MTDDKGEDNADTDLCLANVKGDDDRGQLPQAEPSFAVIRSLHWAKDGRSILGVGVKLPEGSGQFGIVRWRVKSDKPAFSPDTADWNKGRFLTDIDTPGKGVLDAEVSPDGKRLALVSNQGTNVVPAVAGGRPGGLRDVRAPSARRCARARSRGAATARSC